MHHSSLFRSGSIWASCSDLITVLCVQQRDRDLLFIVAQIQFWMCYKVQTRTSKWNCVCFPIITYACEVVNFSHKEMESLHVAVNDAIRKIFSYNRWQSIRNLRESFGYRSITEIFALRRRSFEQRLPCIGNAKLSFLSRL